MGNITTIIIVIVVVIVLGFVFLGGDDTSAPDGSSEDAVMEEKVEDEAVEGSEAMEAEEDAMIESNNAVTYTSSGYSPAILTIMAGETVTFVNSSGGEMWTASDIHPTHLQYPGSDIKKCFDGISVTTALFDSCSSTPDGDVYSFTFSEEGEWNYHNHRRSNHGGTIVVE